MSTQHYETLTKDDPRRAVATAHGSVMLTRWPDEGLPDGFYLSIPGAPLTTMEAIAAAINAAIDARNSEKD